MQDQDTQRAQDLLQTEENGARMNKKNESRAPKKKSNRRRGLTSAPWHKNGEIGKLAVQRLTRE
jgi:hypothetical protein